MSLRRSSMLWPFLLVGLAVSLNSQTSAPASGAALSTFKAKVRVVLVDVVVTNNKGQPVPGLHEDDFEVREDGKPQTVANFDEHSGAPPTVLKLPPLPPHVYSNAPVTQTADSLYILLLDALNTPTRDQAFVHKEMLKYLKTIPPATRVAIFTLSSRLRMVQGVTADSSELLAALNDKKGAAGPHASPLLPSDVENDSNRQLVDFLITADGGNPTVSQTDSAGTTAPAAAVDPVEVMQQFQADTAAYLMQARVRLTLQALQQLGHYLADIPGRKNLIWFSGSFPAGILPDAGLVNPFSSVDDFQKEIRKTTQLLAADDVAIYPVGAEGLAADAVYEANSAEVSQSRGQTQMRDQLQQMRSDSQARDSGHSIMEQLAKDTGGQAFYNTNGLGQVLTRVINEGAHYYTLSYTPTDTNMDGKFRRIEVKLHNGKYKLAYRRGYYALDSETTQSAGRTPDADPLLPFMDRNLPDLSQVIYEIRVLPANPQPAPDAPRIGGNPALKGPVTRYSVDFAVWAPSLKLDPTPDGAHRGAVEVMTIAYDREGKPLNFVGGADQIILRPQAYAAILQRGYRIHEEIDIPKDAAYLRTGVYDLKASTAGTLGLSLHDETAPTSAGK